MWRYLVGLTAAILVLAGGAMWWRGAAIAGHTLPDAPPAGPAASVAGDAPMPEPPAASEKTREERRFARTDHDKNGQVGRDEFLAMRRRNFDKLDADHDGKLGFEEYASKAVERFAGADKDRSGVLNATEFATTRAARTSRPVRCPPPNPKDEEDG